jgi:protease-4
VLNHLVPKRDEKGNPELDNAGKPIEVKYTRVRADGGTFTAAQAQQFKLIDGIEDLPAAVRSAAARAGLAKFKAVVYDRPQTLLTRLTGIEANVRSGIPTLPDASALTPRLWYLAPTADAGLLTPAP